MSINKEPHPGISNGDFIGNRLPLFKEHYHLLINFMLTTRQLQVGHMLFNLIDNGIAS